MTLHEMIYKRRSCRSYTGIPVDGAMLAQIMSFEIKPLYPDIQVRMDIVGRNTVKCICPWTTPQLIVIYSEEKEGYLENVGFMFQQMDLYLQTLGLGSCWLGMGRLNPKTAPEVENMRFVIMLAFGHPKGDSLRHDPKEFRRKRMPQITNKADPGLEPARLAPSSVNSQPWYFLCHNEEIHVLLSRKGRYSDMNRIDMGIALAHLYVANEATFRFFPPREDSAREHIGTVTL